jgi:hypothetical protein
MDTGLSNNTGKGTKGPGEDMKYDFDFDFEKDNNKVYCLADWVEEVIAKKTLFLKLIFIKIHGLFSIDMKHPISYIPHQKSVLMNSTIVYTGKQDYAYSARKFS